jgi:hypothetical protein
MITSTSLSAALWQQDPTFPMTTPPPPGPVGAVDACGLQLDADNDGRPEPPQPHVAFTNISLASLPTCALADPGLSFEVRARLKTDVSGSPTNESVPDAVWIFPSDSIGSSVPLTAANPASFVYAPLGFDVVMPDLSQPAVWNVFAGIPPEGAAGPAYVEIAATFTPTAQMLTDQAVTVTWFVADGLVCFGGLDLIATYDDANCGPGGGVTVSPSSLEVPSGCVCEPITLTITNSTGAPLNGHLLSLSTPADWSTRAASMTYSGGASGIANAPGASFVVSTWPDGGVVTLACELCPGCSDDGVYSVTVDVTSPVGALVASEPVSVGRGVPAPPIAPIAPRVAAPQAAPAKAAAKTTAKRKATK